LEVDNRKLDYSKEERGKEMNQRTHSWIAIRAIALLEDENAEKNLVKLLKPHAREASVGAWIPDQADAKRGGAGAATDNHVLKMEPYTGSQRERFITQKEELLGRIGPHHKTYEFLQNDHILDNAWWNTPYRGDVPKPGQHLPNRAMALGTMMKDLLLVGEKEIDRLIPGEVRFLRYMVPETRTQEEAAAMYFFMLSHFLADSCMPCHCDGRKLAAYSEGLHKELEAHWSRKVGTGFEKRNLLPEALLADRERTHADSAEVLEQARAIDSKFGLDFGQTTVPDLHPGHDIWLEVVNLCRASFAVASIIAPCGQYRYNDPQARAPFETVFGDANSQLLKKVDKIVMHDAVLNTAIAWKHIWNKVSTE
jgi:hypothetical protein